MLMTVGVVGGSDHGAPLPSVGGGTRLSFLYSFDPRRAAITTTTTTNTVALGGGGLGNISPQRPHRRPQLRHPLD
jgi:hypothetical protein